MKLLLLTIVLVLAISVKTQNVKFNYIETDKFGAKCLDGTTPGIYFQEGTVNKFLVTFEGGGKCFGSNKEEMLKSCYERSFGRMGTSSGWRDSTFKKNILNGDSEANPKFHNWNKVFIPYCDGTYHVGYNPEPQVYEGKELFFRGYNNTIAALDTINYDLNMQQADEVLITGASAGAVATIMWINYIREMLHPSVQLWAAPDGGYLISNAPEEQEKEFYQFATDLVYSDVSAIEPKNCPYINDPEQRYKCWKHDELFRMIHPDIPVFLLNSIYDPWSIANTLGLQDCVFDWQGLTLENCKPYETQQVLEFGEFVKENVRELQRQNKNVSAWMPACVKHVFLEDYPFHSQDWTVPGYSLNTAGEALINWMEEWVISSKQVTFIDDVQWPYNSGCANLSLDSADLIE